MPSYLDFNSSKSFRDVLINKTLKQPNGPQTFTASSYSVQTLPEISNINPGDVTNPRPVLLNDAKTSNIFKPTEYFIKETLDTLPRRANLSLYWNGTPYFTSTDTRTLFGILTTDNYDNESELFKFAAKNIKENRQGPIFARIEQNLYTATAGRANIIDALNGDSVTAINLLTGKEPLIVKNYKITTAKTIPGQAIDFLQTVSGVLFPYSEIPGDYLSNPSNPVNYRPEAKTQVGKIFQDVTGVLGSLIGIERRPKQSRKPSDLMIEYMGDGQKSTLFNNLSYSKYKPDYTTTARSQQSSKLFNFVNQFAESAKNTLGIEAPKGNAYIGDDRGEDVSFATYDFNGRLIRSSYYLSLMFDKVQASLFENQKNIGEGGQISGKLTWISKQSNNKLGENNKGYSDESSKFLDSLSTAHAFRTDSILGYTQAILDTMPKDGGAARSHVANAIDQTSRVFREGDKMLSRGSAVQYVNKFTKEPVGVEFARVWTKDRPYTKNSDTMKRTGLIRKFDQSVLSNPWNVNIAPMSNGKNSFEGSTNILNGQATKYMFSIENLAWKTSNKKGFSYNDLPYCERGPNGGRVMWFPPYDLKFNESSNAKWEENTFLGRPEPIYTYQNTSRSGTISFKVVVDHPSIMNLLVKKHFDGMTDEVAENYLNAFFAGCEELDFYGLIRRYSTLDASDVQLIQEYLDYLKSDKGGDDQKLRFQKTAGEGVVSNPSQGQDNTPTSNQVFDNILYFPNNTPYTNSSSYDDVYNGYISEQNNLLDDLTESLINIFADDYVPNLEDRNSLYNQEFPPSGTEAKTLTEFDDAFNKLTTSFNSLTAATVSIKKDITDKKINNIEISIQVSTSNNSDETPTMKLAYNRADSIVRFIAKSISPNSTIPNYNWEQYSEISKEPAKLNDRTKIPLKHLGFSDDIKGSVVINATMIGKKTTTSSCDGIDCHSFKVFNDDGLKRSAPITIRCRYSKLTIKTSLKNLNVDTNLNTGTNLNVDTNLNTGTNLNADTNLNTDANLNTGNSSSTSRANLLSLNVENKSVNRKPPMDALKLIIMKTLSECYYFKVLEENSPIVFTSLKEKLKYFHPGFHSMTPEGLNSRLTFLQQCLRPGDTIPIKGISPDENLDARNTAFGPPPICVLRIGDFYHSKVAIKDVQMTFEDGLLDLNPEGIGVQPMIAAVTMQISFIGGQGLKEPVARLQNALSFNFYGNTEVYDHRSTATEDRTAINKDELQKILEPLIRTPKTPEVAQSPDKPINGKYIGSISETKISYDEYLVKEGDKNIFNATKTYFESYKTKYNELLVKYGELILPLFVSPTYRKKYVMDVNDTISTTTPIELLGVYEAGKEYGRLLADFHSALKTKTESVTSISTLFGFNSFLVDFKINRSDNLLKPYIVSLIDSKIGDLENEKLDEVEKGRNKIINILDGLNFIMSTNGHDGKTEKDSVSGLELSSFNPNDFYDRYSKVIDFIKKESSQSFTDGLDTTINFATVNSTTPISDELYLKIVGVFLNGNENNLLDIYKNSTDKDIFTEHIINKISRKVDDLVIKTKEKRIKFSHPKLKNTNPVTFETVSYTLDSGQEQTLRKVHNSKDNSIPTKLNFLR